MQTFRKLPTTVPSANRLRIINRCIGQVAKEGEPHAWVDETARGPTRTGGETTDSLYPNAEVHVVWDLSGRHSADWQASRTASATSAGVRPSVSTVASATAW